MIYFFDKKKLIRFVNVETDPRLWYIGRNDN
jgi:hypothetical protein